MEAELHELKMKRVKEMMENTVVIGGLNVKEKSHRMNVVLIIRRRTELGRLSSPLPRPHIAIRERRAGRWLEKKVLARVLTRSQPASRTKLGLQRGPSIAIRAM